MASTMALSRLALTARTTRPPASRRYAVAGWTAGPEYRRRRGAATRRVGVRRSEADASQDTARATLLAAAADPTDDDAAARTTLRAIESAWAEVYVPGGVDPVVGGGGAVPTDTSLRVIASLPLEELCHAACRVRDLGHRVITFSPKVFIPLIQACRDECGYCVFATAPPQHRPAFMSLDQVLDVAQAGAAAGCTEALFTLGDKPELKYPSVREELDALGLASTLEYLQVAAAMVLERTGLVPHVNAGVMSQAEVRALRAVSGSQGLMLESTSPRLMDPGGPHYNCPDKLPEARLATVAAAGAARVPFTSGLLVGLGETEEERMDAMLALRDLHAQYGHLQELIIQNFVAKAGTAMADVPSAPLHVLRRTVAMTRLAFGPVMSVQAPPNLAPDGAASWSALLAAGINDWGGISPVTRDFVNPEAPWPHLSSLAATTAAAGFHLVPRLTVYPRYFLNSSHNHTTDAHDDPTALPSDPSSATSQPLLPWVHEKVAPAVRRLADAHGLSRASDWFAGDAGEVAAAEGAAETRRYDAVRTAVDGTLDFSTTNENLSRRKRGGSEMEAAGVQDGSPYTATVGSEEEAHCRHVSTDVRAILDKVQAAAATRVQEGSARAVATLGAGLGAVGGEGLSQEEVARLFECRGADFRAVCEAADALRRSECGDEVSYTVNRNINYTNVCLLSCSFCAFSKGKAAEALRGPSYTLPLDEITWRTAEAWDRGATEVCMQGGIHPDFDGDTYVRIVEAAKRGAPDVHVHAFSPLEVQHGSAAAGVPVPQYLRRLRDAGLSSLPGTAAEVLDDAVRAVLCPDKLSAGEWLEVVSEAHGVGLPTTATLMFGHVDTPVAWAKHLLQLRELQAATGGLTEFVPLPFVHMEAPLYLRGGARRGPTLRESILVHAVARLALFPHVRNVQASWVKMGPQHAAALLSCGCNDVGGVLMNESITRAAGAAHGQSLSAAEMEALVEAVGRTPRQRTTLYADAPAERRRRSLSDAAYMPLAPLRLN